MLVIKVELWPGGDADRAQEIGRMGVANVSNLASTSDYVFASVTDRGDEAVGIIRNHARNAGFWKLVARLAAAADKHGTAVPAKHADTVELVTVLKRLRTKPRPVNRDHNVEVD